VISVGWNKSFKTHPIAKKLGCRFDSIHSELDVINSFPYKISELHKYTLVNIRLMADNTLGISKPCEFCEQLLTIFPVKKIVYSTPKGFVHAPVL
jgi:deoxycytidylate deaminase